MTTGFANTHFIGSAFFAVTPSMALIVVEILFIMAPNKGESTLFKGRISSVRYRQTNFCCLVGGGPPAEVKAVALLAALCLTPAGVTCSVNLTVLRLQMFLQIWRRVFEAW